MKAEVTGAPAVATPAQGRGIPAVLVSPSVQLIAASLVIAWLTWPVETINPPAYGLDASWRAGLNMAAHQSLDFGENLVFTYGPLGFLAQPYLYYPLTAALAGLYVGLLHVATVASILFVARGPLGFVGAAAIAFGVAKLSIVLAPTTLLVPALAFLWCVETIRRDSDRWFVALAVAGGAVGSLELLIRINVGAVVLALVGLTVAMRSAGRARNLAVFAGSAVASFLTFWLAARQDLGAIPEFFRYAYEVVVGHAEAMGYEETGLEWEYAMVAAVGAVVGFVGWRTTDGWSRHQRLSVLALGGALAYVTFKQGFIRHDVPHSAVWFLTGAIVVVALSWRRDRRAETALGIACALLALLGSAKLAPDRLNPLRSAENAVDQLLAIAGPDRLANAGESRAFLRRHYSLGERMLALARGHTVHVHAHEASVAWAYPELRWDPLPVFQSYLAYTKGLDELNARELEADGPDFVLRGLDTPIDGRHFTLEMPQTMLAVFCRYQPVSVAPAWQLLARRPDRCGDPRAIGSVEARIGESFAVPAGSGKGLVLARFRGLPTSLWQRLRTVLFRRDPLYLSVNDDALWRLVPDTAKAPLIVRIPKAVDYPGSFALSIDASSMRIVEGSGGQNGDPLTVDFYEVPVTTGGR